MDSCCLSHHQSHVPAWRPDRQSDNHSHLAWSDSPRRQGPPDPEWFRRFGDWYSRRRDFFGRITEDAYKQAFSTIPQATVSDHNKFTILGKLVQEYQVPAVFPIAESHDSNMFEVRLDIREQFIESFHKAIVTPINFLGCSLSRDYDLVIPGEIGWSADNWGAIK